MFVCANVRTFAHRVINKNMTNKISLILTTYNDAKILSDSLIEITKFFEFIKIEYELLIIDDGSNQENKSILKILEKKYPTAVFFYFENNQGRGAAVKKGIELAANEITGFIDNDLEIPIHYILPMFIEINNSCDFVIARRIYKMELKNFVRYFFTSGYHFLANFLLKLPNYDTESGCKLFKRSLILPLLKYTPNNRWFWDTEIVYTAHIHKLKIKEVVIALNKKYYIFTTVRFFSDIIEYSKNLIKLWLTTKK